MNIIGVLLLVGACALTGYFGYTLVRDIIKKKNNKGG